MGGVFNNVGDFLLTGGDPVIAAHKNALLNGPDTSAQEAAMRRQAEAAERAAKMQEQQAAASAARQQQATNKANVDIANAAAAITSIPNSLNNSTKFTGAMGVPKLHTSSGIKLGGFLDDEL